MSFCEMPVSSLRMPFWRLSPLLFLTLGWASRVARVSLMEARWVAPADDSASWRRRAALSSSSWGTPLSHDD